MPNSANHCEKCFEGIDPASSGPILAAEGGIVMDNIHGRTSVFESPTTAERIDMSRARVLASRGCAKVIKAGGCLLYDEQFNLR